MLLKKYICVGKKSLNKVFHDCLSPKIQIYFGAIYMLWNPSCDESFYVLRTELRNILD